MADAKPSRRSDMKRSFIWACALLLLCLIGIGIYAWYTLRDTDMGLFAAVALGFGIILTLAVGIGLMTLLFYSDRQGFDDEVGR